MKKAEYILAGVSLLALLLKIALVPGSTILSILVLPPLGFFYFIFSAAYFNNIPASQAFNTAGYKGIDSVKVIGSYIAGAGLFITLMGILFRFVSWAGGSVMLLQGMVILFIALVMALIKGPSYKVLLRIGVVGGLALVLWFMPRETWLQLKYRNMPEVMEAYRVADEHPDSIELMKKADEIRRNYGQHK